MLKKILLKVKQVTHPKLITILDFLIYFLAGITLGLIVANCVVNDTFCEGVQDYYMTDL